MGHVPDWLRGSMAKGSAGQAPAKTAVKYGVTSKPIFHSEVQNFADGGGAEAMAVDMSPAPQATELWDINKEVPAGSSGDALGDFIKSETASAAPAESSDMSEHKTFGKAFSAARGAGLKEFDWNGKKFTTQMAGESGSGAAKKAMRKPTVSSTSPEDDYQASQPDTSPYEGPKQDELTYPSTNARKSGKSGKDFVRARVRDMK